MSINLSGLERYQSHQQMGHADTARQTEAARNTQTDATAGLNDDAVSLSDGVLIVEWIAGQIPDLSATEATQPANLGRLSDHLLRYNMVSLPEAGRLMSLAGIEDEQHSTALNGRLRSLAVDSPNWQEKQQWQKLDRLVSNLAAAQSMPTA